MKPHAATGFTAMLLGALLLMTSVTAQAGVFKCTAPDGSVLLTNSPCDKTTRSETISTQRLQPGMLLPAQVGTTPSAPATPPPQTKQAENNSSLLQGFLDMVHQFSLYADQVLGSNHAEQKSDKP